MRLMPPAQLADRKAQDLARELLRTEELNKASDKARKELANAEADFKGTLVRQRFQWAQGEEEHTKRTHEMDVEITALEKRKEQALIPIEIYSRQADEKMSEALECLDTAKARELEAEELGEKLQDKLDDVGQQEQDLNKREAKIILRTLNIEQQEKRIQDNSTLISQRWSELIEFQKQSDKDISNQKEELILKERTLLAKEESLNRTEESLRVWDIRLKDERDTLGRAFKRLSPLPSEK